MTPTGPVWAYAWFVDGDGQTWLLHGPDPVAAVPSAAVYRLDDGDPRLQLEQAIDDRYRVTARGPLVALAEVEAEAATGRPGDGPILGHAWIRDNGGFDGDSDGDEEAPGGGTWLLHGPDPAGTPMAVYRLATGAPELCRALRIEDWYGIADRGPLVALAEAGSGPAGQGAVTG